ncbi:MAG: nucleotide exchange factor GrpE, partial [Spirochaetes bacterium]|nr:nucleotide exchange factor GrpE [Spirochaetota bacterium]
ASDSDDEVAQLRARVQELEHENSELKDQYLRKQADFENFRKRMTREKADAIAYANKQLLLDILQIIDDFERAIKSAEESRDFDSFHEGVALIEKQFTSMLERKWGLRRFDSEGEEFDPQKHEAVMTGEDGDHDHPVVLEDYQKGYFLNDKVLRSAKVKVSVPSGKSGEEQS